MQKVIARLVDWTRLDYVYIQTNFRELLLSLVLLYAFFLFSVLSWFLFSQKNKIFYNFVPTLSRTSSFSF